MHVTVMKETNIGNELAQLRKAAKISQADLSERMGVDQSSVSRMESDPNPAREDIDKYLAALNGDPAAKEFAVYLDSTWTHVGKPAFQHPYRHELEMAESAIEKLQAFASNLSTPAELKQQAKLYEDGLRETAVFLLDLKHNFAFVGNIMVGKTTALCFITDLLIEGGKSTKARVALETGGGWVTLCEVRVSTLDSGQEESGKFGLVLQTHPQEEVFRLANDVCASVFAMRDGTESESRVPEEVEKVLRSMAEVPRRPSKEPDGGLEDPLLELAKTHDTPARLTAEFQTRMKLGDRTTTALWFDAPTLQDGLAWLQEEFRKVNSGRNPKVSLAKRIDVFVPMPLLKDCDYDLSCFDSKGTDETVIRPDIQAHLDDPRTVTILCSHFAPDAAMFDVLGHLSATGKRAAISNNMIFMVLARRKDALAINSEDESQIERVEDAYALRKAQIRSKLARFPDSKHVPIVFYDAVEEKPVEVRKELLKKLDTLRAGRADRLKEIVAATEDLLTKHQEQQVKTAFLKLRSRLQSFVESHHHLPDRTTTADSQLLNAFNRRHARTVWASTRRNGAWDNLNSYQIAGVSANMDAETRAKPAATAIETLLGELSKDPDCATIKTHLSVLAKNLADWKLTFLKEVTRKSEDIFRAVLFPDNKLWDACEAYWPQGKGFRNKVVGDLRQWLGEPKHSWIQDAVEGIIRKDWQDLFIAQVQAQCKPEAAPAP
jgi:transcriptional regulator with XRE-family HTH domain